MVQRNKSHRLESEATPQQLSSKGSQNMPNTTGHATRPCRQFSTRSRAKSTASFKGFHRILPIDVGVSDVENSHHFGEHSFRKSRSSDSLYRKRAISGLNMTALTRVKSNPSHIISSSRPSSVNSSTQSPGAGSTGLKPSTSRSRHSVIDLHDGDEVYDDDTTTDEEVEYFSDEEDDDGGKSQKSSPSDEIPKQSPVRIHRTPQETDMLSKSFTELTLPYQKPDGEPPIVNQPSYKAPSSLIKPRHAAEQLLENNYNEKMDAGKHNFSALQEDGTAGASDKIDRIDNPNLTIMETGAHSLKRQGKNFTGATEESTSETSNGGNNYLSQRRNSDNQEYIPNMILSQSTGVERRFDQPTSLQNSFGNNYRPSHVSQEVNREENYNIAVNKENQFASPPNLSADQHLPRQELQQPRQQHQQQQHQQQNNTLLQQSNNGKGNTQHNFSTSISSLTNSLQRMAPENSYSASRKSHLTRRKPSQISFSGSILRAASGDLAVSTPPSSDINNFAQFLKSDNMDGESRTQRKLWLQRENSIMDLTSQHDSGDSIFMASNIEVKREFERISHEYINVRRFSNPIEEALSRVESEQKILGIETSDSNGSDALDVIFSNPVNGAKEMDQLLSHSHNTDLHNVLQSIWKEESALFNKDTNPVNRNKSPTSAHSANATTRTSLKNVMNPGAALQHQRMINSLQPTTRAVNRRIENAMHQQQRL
ncbi:TCO89 (YPL180W) [Zygosaccharomyces parabailii]|nr:TCO89 (YPL180W) [Zygosaccharomyces parabailii]CDH10269.1 uncharacterized protein ZBAI_02054 [Zygosaccharomyces bailii ISA1307]